MIGENRETNELTETSRLMLLVTYTLFTIVLTIESVLLGWEVWALVLIILGVVVSWILHIRQITTDIHRTWIISGLMMATFFFYGIHSTSTFDLAVVMSAVIILYTMTGIRSLVLLCQVTFYVTMLYELILMLIKHYTFDTIMISRYLLHIAVITMVAWLARTIMDKWRIVLESSQEEVVQLTESTKRLNDFLSNVSHEIRTPVNAVIGLSTMCIDKEESESVREDIVAIQKAGRRIAGQIEDILDYSELDRGSAVVNSEDYMLSSMIHDMVVKLREKMTDDVELIIDIDPAIPSVMNTDVSKLKKILMALILNGLKYTRSGAVYVKLVTEKHSYGVNLCIEVTDTGIGMTDEELERVYERFYQKDSGTARVGGGLGLGLSIVSGFVALLGGFMTISSKLNEGTTVKVSIPQKVVDDSGCMSVEDSGKLCIGAYLHFDKFTNPLVREYYNSNVLNIVRGLRVQMHRVDNMENLKKLHESLSMTHLFIGQEEYEEDREYIEQLSREMIVVVVASPGYTVPSSSMIHIMEKPFYCFPVVSVLNTDFEAVAEKMGHMVVDDVKVLVVDDEPMNLIVAKSIFKSYGIKVDTASSGPESIKMCKNELYDIIFMDHMMGGMDGVEAMKRIRSDVSGLGHNVPMVALTANTMSTARQMFMREGFDGFVSKPIEIKELERVLKRLVPTNRIRYIFENEKTVTEEKAPDEVKEFSAGSDEVMEFSAGGDEVMEFSAGGDEVMEFSAGGDEVMEFSPGGDEVMEFSAGGDEVMEFSPGGDDVMEFSADTNSSEKSSTAASGTLRSRLKDAGLDLEAGLGYCNGDLDFLIMIIKEYLKEYHEKTKLMKNYLEQNDIKNYEIIIHALKSTSKMIGAMDISEEALQLEKAAKEERTDYIDENHERVMEMYREVYEKISAALDSSAK